jgi:hypothetical protein
VITGLVQPLIGDMTGTGVSDIEDIKIASLCVSSVPDTVRIWGALVAQNQANAARFANLRQFTEPTQNDVDAVYQKYDSAADWE